MPELDDKYRLRWFTPTVEVDMCGHATLASAAVVLERLKPEWPSVTFNTRSGPLSVRRRVAEGGAESGAAELTMDFPLWPASEMPAPAPSSLVAALGGVPAEAFPIPPLHGGAPYWLFLFNGQEEVAALSPDFSAMEANVLTTSTAADSTGGEDFVSRFFGPCIGIPEDPVTGSAHCTLAHFWNKRLGGQRKMRARQISERGGELALEVEGERVLISGACTFFMEGSMSLPVPEA